MTDTATIELSNVIYTRTRNVIQENSLLTATIKRGDPVWIYSDFDTSFDALPLKFQGFVSRATGGEVITVVCDDYMYVLKNINVPSKRFNTVTLKDYVKYILQGAKIGYELIDPEMNLGTIQIDNNSLLNAVQCLEVLKETYGLVSYFNGKILHIGKVLNTSEVEHNFIFQHNIIEDNLTYRNDEDVNLVIKGISLLDNDTKIERFAYMVNGEKKVSLAGISGEQITLNYYNKTAEQLEELLLNNFEKYIYKGYSGNFMTVLRPDVNPGDKVNLFNISFPERDGKYRIKGVRKETGMDGGYQTIEIDYKIGDL